MNTRTWELLYNSNENLREEDPKGRYRHEIAMDENYIYIFGGGTQDASFDMDIIPAYNFAENKFIFIQTKGDPSVTANGGYPDARKFHSCVQHQNDVIITGGSKQVGQYFDDIWRFSLETRHWQLLTQVKLPYPLFFHDAAGAGNGQMYIFGGVTPGTNLDLVRTNDLHKIWIKIPTLGEICWEAMTYYHSSIADKTKEELLSIGIPRKYAERATHGRNLNVII